MVTEQVANKKRGPKRFRIPNVDVLLNELEVRVVHTRQFQRLFYLRQLGLAYLVYPGATHTRGVHSIETLYQANRILESLKTRDEENNEAAKWNIQEDDCRAIRLAALLHDIGHIPFSHTLEDEHCVLTKHDGRDRIDKAFELLYSDLGDDIDAKGRGDLENAKKILIAIAAKDEPEQKKQNNKDKVSQDKRSKKGESRKEETVEVKSLVQNWKSDIVGNTICADLLAYINADSAWTGIEKRSGHYRIYDYFVLAEKTDVEGAEDNEDRRRLCIQLTKDGVLRTDVVSAILDILSMRYTLTERVLFHHAKCVASAMLARAARLCRLEDGDCERLREDRDTGKTNGQPMAENVGHLNEGRSLLRMGDEALLDLLESRASCLPSDEHPDAVLRLVRQLRSRRLYKRVFKVSTRERDAKNDGIGDTFSKKWRESKRVEETLKGIEDSLELPRGSLVLWCSDPKAGKKLVRVNVVWDSEDGKYPVQLRDVPEDRFPTVHRRVKAVEEQYNDLWCLWVAMDEQYIESAALGVFQALENRLGVACDKMFKEGHLRSLLALTEEKEEANLQVKETLIPIARRVVENLVAVPGLKGDDNKYSQATIISLFASEINKIAVAQEEPQKKRSRQSLDPGQLEITSDEQRDEKP